MQEATWRRLVRGGEDSGLVLCGDEHNAERVAKNMGALANTRGGSLVFGVRQDGTITGVNQDLMRWISTSLVTYLKANVHPKIYWGWEKCKVDGHYIVVITVPLKRGVLHTVRLDNEDDIYIRIGAESRRGKRHELVQLLTHRIQPHPELLPVSGSGFRDLSRDRMRDYLTRIVGDSREPSSEDRWGERLCKLGFLAEQEQGPPVCTIAGLVLFGSEPRRLLGQAGVRWMAFDGDGEVYRPLDDQVVDGPLVPLLRVGAGTVLLQLEGGLVERLEGAMQPFVSEEVETVSAPMRRERRWHYPTDAVREAVVNALAHRDWTRNEEVEVARYADRLVVTSPGALQNTMTVEKMIAGQRSPHNPLIVEVLRDYAYADARGMGVRNKIIPLVRQSSGREPEFQATEDHLQVTMRRGAGSA